MHPTGPYHRKRLSFTCLSYNITYLSCIFILYSLWSGSNYTVYYPFYFFLFFTCLDLGKNKVSRLYIRLGTNTSSCELHADFTFKFFPFSRAFIAPPILISCITLLLTLAFPMPSLLIITFRYAISTVSDWSPLKFIFAPWLPVSVRNENLALTWMYSQHLPLVHFNKATLIQPLIQVLELHHLHTISVVTSCYLTLVQQYTAVT